MKKVFCIFMSVTILLVLNYVINTEKVYAAAAEQNVYKNVDVNNDRSININDLAIIASNYNKKSSQAQWNSKCDINNDLIIDIYDLTFESKYLGTTLTFNNMSSSVSVGDTFTLPKEYLITSSTGCKFSTPVSWNQTIVNTTSAGNYTYTGNLTDYNLPVTLTLTVIAVDPAGVNHGNIVNMGIVAKSNGWIYYMNEANSGKLSKVKSDGTSVTKLTDDVPLYINVVGQWVYYSNVSDNYSIYRINIDGTQRTKLNNAASEYLNAADGWIFYMNDDDGYSLHKISVDGNQDTKLNSESSPFINVIGDWIYYCNYSNYGEVCKVKKDGTGKAVINDDSSESMIVDNGWIYYANIGDQDRMYRIRIDGTGRAEIPPFEAKSFNVSGDWLYLINEGMGGSIYRIKTDSSYSPGTITDEEVDRTYKYDTINILDNDIYSFDSETYNLYRIRNDGSGKMIFGVDNIVSKVDDITNEVVQGEVYQFPDEVIAVKSDGSVGYVPITWNATSIDTSNIGSTYHITGTVANYNYKVNLTVTVVQNYNPNGNSINGALIAQKDGWFYFADNLSGQLYKMKTDGTEKTKLSDDMATDIHLSSDWIFYIANNNIYKIKNDGSQRTCLSGYRTYTFNMYSDSIFFVSSDNQYSIYRMKTDGSGLIQLNTVGSSNINITSNYIYYKITSDSNIYRMRWDGSGQSKIVATPVDCFDVYNGCIYYEGGYFGNDGIFKAQIDGSNAQKLCSDSSMYMNVSNGWIYYANGSDADKLYKIRIDGTGKTKLTDDNLYCAGYGFINVLDNYVYYKNYSDNQKLYRVTTDGTDRQLFN